MPRKSLSQRLSYAPIRDEDRKRAHRRLDEYLDTVERAVSTDEQDPKIGALIHELDRAPQPYRQDAIEEIGKRGSQEPATVVRQVEDLLQYAVFEPWRMAPIAEALAAVAEECPERILPHLDVFVTAADFHRWTEGHEALSETLAAVADGGYEDSLQALCEGLLEDPNRRHQGLDLLVLIAREDPEFALNYLDEFVEDLNATDADRFSSAFDGLVEFARHRPEELTPTATEHLLELGGRSIEHAPTWGTLQTCAALVVQAPETLGECRRPLLTHLRSMVDDRPVEALDRTYESHPGQSAANLLVHLVAERPDVIPDSQIDPTAELLEGAAAFYEEHAPEGKQGFDGPKPRDDPTAATKLRRTADYLRAHAEDPEGDYPDPRRDFYGYGRLDPLRPR